MKLTRNRWVRWTGVGIGIALLAWAALGSVPGVDDAEAALRRGLASAARGIPDSTVLLTVHESVPPETLQLSYETSFVDAFLIDTSDLWRALTRSAFVWLVCYSDGSIYVAEVREEGGRWIGWLSPTPDAECRGRTTG